MTGAATDLDIEIDIEIDIDIDIDMEMQCLVRLLFLPPSLPPSSFLRSAAPDSTTTMPTMPTIAF